MRTPFAAGIAFAIAFSGCTATPEASHDTPPSVGPATYPWGISECRFVILSVPVDAERLARHLPPGFALRPSQLPGLPTGEIGAVELDAYQCLSGVGLHGTLDGVQYGSYYAAVTPPQALREAGYDAYFVKWDVLVPDVDRRYAFELGGLPAHGGAAHVDVGTSGGRVTAQLEFADGGGFRFEGAVGALEPQRDPLPFMEHTPLKAGNSLAAWHARLHDANIGSGAGEVEILPGSWVAELVGSSRVPATAIAGEWNLDEADVTFPVPWPAPSG